MTAMKCKKTDFHHRHAIPQAISRPAKMTWKSAEKLKAADETLGIPVLNHIIFSHKGHSVGAKGRGKCKRGVRR